MKNICYESTGTCNLKCDYCISSDNLKNQGKQVNYEKIIDTIALFQPQRIVISGGEPLLDTELLDKLKLIRIKCPSTFVSLSTNGAVKYDLLPLLDYIDCIDFSLPSIDGDIYAKMRGQDCTKQVIENIEAAKRHNMNLRLSYTLTKINTTELLNILDFAEKMKISEVRIGRFFPFRDAASCNQKYELSDDEIKNIMNSINENDYSFRIVPPIEKLEYMESGYLTINYWGEIFLPSREGKRKIAMVGEIDEDRIKEIEQNQGRIFVHTNMTKSGEYLSNMLLPKRIRPTSSEYKRSVIEEFYSDRSRIIYSQAFRRLQQKAQVFSLETNSSVRSRLSHSIEVSDVGRLMSQKIAQKMIALPKTKKYHLDDDCAEQLVAIVENACLLHDLGNPPFGHFGETAIQKWWNENYKGYINSYNKRAKNSGENAIAFTTQRQKSLLQDFQQFDGNPQGLRTILRFRNDEVLGEETGYYESGMNLTYQTILSCIKYVRCAGEKSKDDINFKIQKKAGYFQSEKSLIYKIYDELSLPSDRRFPLVYIMEAADDISYCMSDVADSIEKGLTTLKQFTQDFEKIWKEEYKEGVPANIISPEQKRKIDNEELKDINIALTSGWAAKLTEIAANRFVENIDEFMEGNAEAILSKHAANAEDEIWYKLSDVLGKYARRNIYSAAEAESIEIAGYSIIKGLLDNFGRLLALTKGEFEYLLDPKNNPKDKKLDVEARYCHLLGKKYIHSYGNQLTEWKRNLSRELSEEQLEWWLRVHLIIDHIAGMTDEYALKTYQLCKGICINILK
ncbi:MAG: dGTPase [Lachnospiraceae bacterium]|nr:dGTPase [Lachnospiraceae bacterium]